VGNYPPGYSGYAAASAEQVTKAIDVGFRQRHPHHHPRQRRGASDVLIAAQAMRRTGMVPDPERRPTC
jgi:hypothetical protein